MKNSLYILFLLICSTAFSQQLTEPIVSVGSGFYTTNVNVSISHSEPGVTLFYTLNGSEPNPSSQQYTGPITFASKIGDPNNFSTIPTNPGLTYPVGDYSAQRANNRGWLLPNGEVFKINILRVKAYKAGFVPSNTVTKSIGVDPQGASIYDFPIVSFVMDSIDLFSNATGIYHYGSHPDGNYSQKGAAWERIANMEYFDENGVLQVDQEVRTRIHGGGSRHSTKKTFRVYAEYGDNSNFHYTFFDDYQLDKYKRILIRSGGHRPDCFPRDDLANLITKGLNGDQQHSRHVILFLNGEYWGIHTIKERMDQYFIQNQYGIDDNDLTVLDQEYNLQGGGNPQDSADLVAIETHVITVDMTNPDNYYWVADQIDMNNYIDYMASEIFLSNEDWVYSNVAMWRKSGPLDPSKGPGQDGKYRWIFYDFDGAFGGSCSNAYYTVNTLNAATITTGTFSSYSRLFRGLLDSPIFRDKWINRICDLMNSNFTPVVLNEKLYETYDLLTPSMMENVNRWGYPSEATTLADRMTETPSLVQWDTTFYYLNRFASRRQSKVREHIMLKWAITDTSHITIDVNDQNMGSVQINTIRINSELPGVEAGVYPWTGTYINSVESQLVAVPMPGYEFVEWLETGNTSDTISWIPAGDTTMTAIFQASSDFLPVVINEVMPSNGSYMADNFGEYDDWLELYNPNPFPVNLSLWTLERDTMVWKIKEGTVIEANSYQLIWHDNQLYQGANHANFKLQNNTTTVYLYSPTGGLIDYLIYPNTTQNHSFGRYPNGSGTFADFSYPTPLQNNDISSVDELPEISDLIVYPNPTNNDLWLSKICNYELYSMDGKLVMSDLSTSFISLAGIQSGTYILLTDDGSRTKIIVQK